MLALVLASGVIALFFWFAWGERGWPVGSFWWDELALAGAAEAVNRGMVPTVDFWAPFIWPIYAKYVSVMIGGYSGAFLVESLMQGVLVLALFCWLIGGTRPGAATYWVGALAVLSAVAPFNLMSVSEAQLGALSYSCAYNRLGGSLISLVILLPTLPQSKQRVNALSLWVSVVFVLAFLLKITVFQVAWGLLFIWAVLKPRDAGPQILLSGTLVAAVALVALAHWGIGGQGYLSTLKYLSDVRISILKPHLINLLQGFAIQHRIELAVFLLSALLFCLHAALSRRSGAPHVLFYMASCLVVSLYTITNYGDNGMMPAMAAFCVLFSAFSADTDARLVSERFRSIRDMFRISMHVLFGVLMTFYFSMVMVWAGALYLNSREAQLVSSGVRNEFLLKNYVFSREVWERSANLTMVDLPLDLSRVDLYAGYVKDLDKAVVLLEQLVPDRKKRIYAFDFPAYVFSLVANYQIPTHSFPWLLFGHEVTLDHHPDASQLLSDVDVLMVPICSLSGGNRKWLFPLYRVYIESHFNRKGSTRCWALYERTKP